MTFGKSNSFFRQSFKKEFLNCPKFFPAKLSSLKIYKKVHGKKDAETYSETSQIFKIEQFAVIVNNF